MEKKKKFTTVCDARLASFEGFLLLHLEPGR